ncbi:hypothetical protein ROZALSC1DRAFT_28469 [Rozella allomycis CSF55]|uniref:Uncharacterized protein n=1 Tax=Rozella allomycis (strain CSF55) TaxID=988480 RepID=A0A4P9YK61_ROZAC|nr:hypothetical protein ROZALSC1DRAFT_28469 [Rozella allomycis CSF55]
MNAIRFYSNAALAYKKLPEKSFYHFLDHPALKQLLLNADLEKAKPIQQVQFDSGHPIIIHPPDFDPVKGYMASMLNRALKERRRPDCNGLVLTASPWRALSDAMVFKEAFAYIRNTSYQKEDDEKNKREWYYDLRNFGVQVVSAALVDEQVAKNILAGYAQKFIIGWLPRMIAMGNIIPYEVILQRINTLVLTDVDLLDLENDVYFDNLMNFLKIPLSRTKLQIQLYSRRETKGLIRLKEAIGKPTWKNYDFTEAQNEPHEIYRPVIEANKFISFIIDYVKENPKTTIMCPTESFACFLIEKLQGAGISNDKILVDLPFAENYFTSRGSLFLWAEGEETLVTTNEASRSLALSRSDGNIIFIEGSEQQIEYDLFNITGEKTQIKFNKINEAVEEGGNIESTEKGEFADYLVAQGYTDEEAKLISHQIFQ